MVNTIIAVTKKVVGALVDPVTRSIMNKVLDRFVTEE